MNTNDKNKLLRVQMQGAFRISGPNGEDLTPRGQKACAIIAMLATHPEGTRSRSWLRERLWSERGHTEGNSSLRQSLSEIRRTFGEFNFVLKADRRVVKLARNLIDMPRQNGTFLEDLSIQDPEFNEWAEGVRKRGSFGKVERAIARQEAETEPPPAIRAPLSPLFPKVRVTGVAYASPGFEEALILQSKLSDFRWLSVAYSEGEEAQVDYTVSLTPSTNGEGIAGLSLSDGHGRTLWSVTRAQYERLDPTLPFLDDMAGNLAALMSMNEEQMAANAPVQGDLRNLLARGRWHLDHMTREDARIAADLFGEARAIAPEEVEVMLHIAFAAVARAWAFRLDAASLEEVISIARSAMVRAPHDARSYYNLGTALCFAGRAEMARPTIEEAIRICPNMAMAWIQQGCNLLALGEFEEAVPVYHRCLALSRFERRSYIPRCGLGMAHLFLGQNDLAVEAAERAIAMRPGYWYAHMVRGVALRRLGEQGEASRSLATMRKIFPRISKLDVTWLPIGDAKALDRVILDAGISD